MPTVSSLREDINWNAFTLAQYSGGKLIHLFSIPRYHREQCRVGSCGFSKRKALGDKGRGDDHRVIE